MSHLQTPTYRAQPEPSRLLSLPYELRLLIWDQAISVLSNSGKCTYEPYALLQTCRQTFVEIAPCIRRALAERLNESEIRHARAAERAAEDNDRSVPGRRKQCNRQCMLAFRRRQVQRIRNRLGEVEALVKLAKEMEDRV